MNTGQVIIWLLVGLVAFAPVAGATAGHQVGSDADSDRIASLTGDRATSESVAQPDGDSVRTEKDRRGGDGGRDGGDDGDSDGSDGDGDDGDSDGSDGDGDDGDSDGNGEDDDGDGRTDKDTAKGKDKDKVKGADTAKGRDKDKVKGRDTAKGEDRARGTGKAGDRDGHVVVTGHGTVVVRSVGNASRSNGAAGPSVDFDVTNVTTGRPIPLTLPNQSVSKRANTSSSAVNGSVTASNASMAVDRLDVTVTNGSNFTMNVTTADEPLNTTPAFEGTNGTEPLSHVRVNHSVSDADIENVTFSFRLSNERLDEMGVSPLEVALYRYHDGEWVELPTEVLGATTDGIRFEAESPGLSEFAAGAKRPKFELEGASVDVEKIEEGDDIDVYVTVTNLGGADGRFHADLILDDIVVTDRDVSVAAGGQRRITFERALEVAGTYEVRVNGVLAGIVTVEASEVSANGVASERDTTAMAAEREATGNSGIDGASAVGGGLFVGLSALVFVWARRRSD